MATPNGSSTALAIAQVTAALKDLLQGTLKNASEVGLGEAGISLSAPDRITTGENEPSALNLFLYRVSPHMLLQDSKVRLKLPLGAVALDLFYLLTAYGSKDYQAEILLGYAVQAMSAVDSLTPDELRRRLKSASNKALAKAEVGPHALKIVAQFMSMDDMSKLWSSLQAKYRPSVAYQVTAVVLGGNGNA